MNNKLLEEIWKQHRGKITGACIGFFCGVFILLFGFLHTLFVFICSIVGYVIGKRMDEKEDIMDILDRLLPPGYHR